MCKSRLLFVISIHAPTRGATFFVAFSLLLYLHFNPRSHEGSDGTDGGSRLNLPISIHAPTRGATLIYMFCQVARLFQSTLPRGERQQYDNSSCLLNHFNPRSHEGSDHVLLYPAENPQISIHAPTRGATATLTNFFFYNQSIFC